MAIVMKDDGDSLVVNDTEVGRGAKHPNKIDDIQLVRFYLDISDNMGTPPTGSFDTTGINVMTEEPGLAGRILRFQQRQARSVNSAGFAFVLADGKVSVPHNVSDGSLGYGTGRRHGLYTIRQMALTWGMYKIVNNLSDTFKISAHPLCANILRGQLVQMGL